MNRKVYLIATTLLMSLASCQGGNNVSSSSASSKPTSSDDSNASSSIPSIISSSAEEKLDAPTRTKIRYERFVIHWEEVAHADAYEIKLDQPDAIPHIVRTTQFAISAFEHKNFKKGEPYGFYLRALSDGDRFAPSSSVRSTFTLSDTNDELERLFGNVREYAPLDGYGTTVPIGEDITEDVKIRQMYLNELAAQGINTQESLTPEGYEAVYRKVKAKMSYESISEYVASKNAFYLGDVVAIDANEDTNGERFVTGTNLTLDEITMFSSELGGESITVDFPEHDTVNSALHQLRQDTAWNNQVANAINVDEVYSRQELNYILDIPQDVSVKDLPYNLDSEATNIAIVAQQIYYTVEINPIKQVYKHLVQTDDMLSAYLERELCPAYVSSVSYGRTVMILITIKDTISDTVDTGEVGNSMDDIALYVNRLESTVAASNISFRYFVYGDTKSLPPIDSSSNVDDIIAALQDVSTCSNDAAQPLSYTLSYLDGTGDTARVGSCSEYYVKEYRKIEA